MRYLASAICAFSAFIALCSCSRSAPTSAQLKAYAEAKASYAAGRLNEAEGALLPLAEAGSLPQAAFLLGKARFFLGKYEEASSSFRGLATDFPKYHEASLWIARTCLQQGRIDEAERIAHELLANDSSDSRLYYLEAMIASAKGDLMGALGFLERSSDSGEDLAKSLFESARIYYQFGQDEKAVEKLLRARALLSTESPSREAIDELLARLGKAGK